MKTYAELANLYICYSERDNHLNSLQQRGSSFIEQEFTLRQLLSIRDMIASVEKEILNDYNDKASVHVEYGFGTRWCVYVADEEESRHNWLRKHDAMYYAREIAKREGRKIIEQKLSRKESRDNMKEIWDSRKELGFNAL